MFIKRLKFKFASVEKAKKENRSKNVCSLYPFKLSFLTL